MAKTAVVIQTWQDPTLKIPRSLKKKYTIFQKSNYDNLEYNLTQNIFIYYYITYVIYYIIIIFIIIIYNLEYNNSKYNNLVEYFYSLYASSKICAGLIWEDMQ